MSHGQGTPASRARSTGRAGVLAPPRQSHQSPSRAFPDAPASLLGSCCHASPSAALVSAAAMYVDAVLSTAAASSAPSERCLHHQGVTKMPFDVSERGAPSERRLRTPIVANAARDRSPRARNMLTHAKPLITCHNDAGPSIGDRRASTATSPWLLS